MNSDVDGLVVAVTGATGGIGRAVTRALLDGGARVAAGYHRTEADQLEDLLGTVDRRSLHPVELDVSDSASCQRFVDDAAEHLGGLDGLVNNAGVMEQVAFEHLDEATWMRTLDVNTNGPYRCTRAALPHLTRSDRASVVNISSQMAYVGGPGSAAYCTSKAAVLGLTRALAHDLQPGVRVNAVAPGPITTPMTAAHMSEDYVALKTHRLAMKRFGTPEEVAAAVCFLLGDGASYFTGQTLSPNGGGAMP